MISNEFARHFEELKKSASPDDRAIGLLGEAQMHGGGTSSCSSASSLYSQTPELSRSSTFDTSTSTPPSPNPPLAPPNSPASRHGLPQHHSHFLHIRASSFGSESDVDAATVKNGLGNVIPETYGGTSWAGYADEGWYVQQLERVPSITLSDPGAREKLVKAARHFPVHRDEMTGEGRYRVAKEASEELQIQKTLEQVQGVSGILGRWAGEDLKIRGREKLTYAQISRLRYERSTSSANDRRIYHEEKSKDSVTIQHGFPTQPVQLDPDKYVIPKHLRPDDWTTHEPTAREFNFVHKLGIDPQSRRILDPASLKREREILEDLQVKEQFPQAPPAGRVRFRLPGHNGVVAPVRNGRQAPNKDKSTAIPLNKPKISQSDPTSSETRNRESSCPQDIKLTGSRSDIHLSDLGKTKYDLPLSSSPPPATPVSLTSKDHPLARSPIKRITNRRPSQLRQVTNFNNDTDTATIVTTTLPEEAISDYEDISDTTEIDNKNKKSQLKKKSKPRTRTRTLSTPQRNPSRQQLPQQQPSKPKPKPKPSAASQKQPQQAPKSALKKVPAQRNLLLAPAKPLAPQLQRTRAQMERLQLEQKADVGVRVPQEGEVGTSALESCS